VNDEETSGTTLPPLLLLLWICSVTNEAVKIDK